VRVRSVAADGQFNHANGVAALLAATRLGAELPYAARAVAQVADVAGRFRVVEIAGVPTRLVLAKNPAGFAAVLDLVAPYRTPVVVAINARVADGLDPSWLYDVDFERLVDRRVIATGDRWRDVSARLFYAGVPHECVPSARDAIASAVRGTWGVDVVANYTAFAELHGSL
jgi:lipid II isoglutaminyl synthase (glutamine-hydrolysing)